MKKFYFLLLGVMLSALSMQADDYTITLNLDDASRYQVLVGQEEKTDLVTGDNVITAPEYTNVIVKTVGDYLFENIQRTDSEYPEYIGNKSEWTVGIYSSYNGVTWNIRSYDAEAARDLTCKVIVDAPEKVTVQRSGTYTYVTLQPGENTVKLDSSKENPLMISPKDYRTSLYQVLLNDEVQRAYGTQYYITVAEGDVVKIDANYPEVPVAVKFTYGSEEAKGSITSVTVDGQPVTNYNDDNFTVMMGSTLAIDGNQNDYTFNVFKVNDNTEYFAGRYSTIIKGATTFYIEAAKIGTYKVKVNVDNPEAVSFYKGYSYSGERVTLAKGDNELEVSSRSPILQVKANEGYYLTELSAGDATISSEYDGSKTINATDGMEMTIRTAPIVRDKVAMLYVDDRSLAQYYMSLQRADRFSIDPVTGYQRVEFYEGDNDFILGLAQPSTCVVLQNGTQVEPQYQGSTTYQLTLADGDVIKVFMKAEPETFHVTFDAEGVEASQVAVVRDSIVAVSNWPEGMDVETGTAVTLTSAEGYIMTVKVNGEEVAADENGVVSFNVDAATVVSLTSVPTGISALQPAEAEGKNVYNAEGKLVLRQATRAALGNLPAGVYVVGGKKCVVAGK